MTALQIYLASNSPRRRELLDQIGVRHVVMPVDVDETPQPGEHAADVAMRLALAKARAGWAAVVDRQLPPLPVLGADTVVAVDDHVLGKPLDRADALAMLARLSGRCHQVFTAVAVVHAGGEAQTLSASNVCFRAITPGEAAAYWDTGEPADKAGSYAIQGLGAVFITRLEGSFSGVAGLPLCETAALLAGCGVTPLVDI